MYPLIVFKVKKLKLSPNSPSREESFLASTYLLARNAWYSLTWVWINPVSASFIIWHGPYVSAFPSSYKDTCHRIRSYHHQIWPHLNVIISSKNLFPNEFAFRGSRWNEFQGGHCLPPDPSYSQNGCCYKCPLLETTRYLVIGKNIFTCFLVYRKKNGFYWF